MRVRVGRFVLVAALVVASMLAGGVANAGGPTSVLVASPGTDRAAALYVTSAAYQQLESLLGGSEPAGGPAPEGVSRGSYVNVTWLVHDVNIWRVDRIYLGSPDDVWVVTATGAGLGPVDVSDLTPDGMATAGVWHRPTDTAALRALLDRIGVTGQSPGDPGAGWVPVADPPTAAVPDPLTAAVPDPPTAAVAGPPSPGAPAPAPWGWVGVGAAGGAALAWLGLLALPGLRRRVLPAAGPRPEPRAEEAVVTQGW